MLGAAAALHAGVGLQADELREVGAGDEAEVFIARERGNLREAAAGEKDGDRAEQQVQVLGVGNDGQEGEQGESVHPPEDPSGACPRRRRRRRPGRWPSGQRSAGQ